VIFWPVTLKAITRTSTLFTDLEKLVLDYTVGISQTPVEVPDALFADLRGHSDDAQIVELTHVIALENLRGRFNPALGIGATGFSEGMACELPATAPNRNQEAKSPTSDGESLNIQ
jgi:hypothetical protein